MDAPHGRPPVFNSMCREDEDAPERCTDLFFPTYSLALAPDPLLSAAAPPSDIFLSVGLDSGLTDFKRPRLNLLVLLDVSGSMDSGFGGPDRTGSKIEVAKSAILGMMDRLGEGDALGICLFDSSASTLAPLGGTDAARLGQIRAAVTELRAGGCTDLQAGMELATVEIKRFAGYRAADAAATETRMMIITDARPNGGDFSSQGLTARIKANALDGIHTTVVGVGLDFNTELVEEIGKAKGANYLSVHTPGERRLGCVMWRRCGRAGAADSKARRRSARGRQRRQQACLPGSPLAPALPPSDESRTRLCDDFDCLVSPLVFDLALKLDPASLAAGWRILHAYGSPNPQDSALSEDGTVMKVCPGGRVGAPSFCVFSRLHPVEK